MADDQKDITWSVKTSTQNKKEIEGLIDQSGLTSKDFFEQMILQYQKNQLEGSEAEKSQDIQQVTYYLEKIKNHFIATIEKGFSLQAGYSEWMEKESQTHKQIIDEIQRQKVQAEIERDKANVQVKNVEEVLSTIVLRNEELESNNKTHRITIDLLEGKANELETRIGKSLIIEEDNQRLIDENIAKSKNIESVKHGYEELQKESNVIIDSHKKELAQAYLLLENERKESLKSIEQIKQIHKLEMGMAIIETEKKMLESVQKIKDEYGSKIEVLVNKNQELIEKNHNLEMKVKLEVE